MWKENPAFVHALGIAPLLAVSSTVVNGLLLGFAFLLTITLTSAIVSATRYLISPEVRLPYYVTVMAVIVTVIQQVMLANYFELTEALGIYLPVIAANCLILQRVESVARHCSVLRSVFDAFATGLGVLGIVLTLAFIREPLGYGSLFVEIGQLFGDTENRTGITFGSGQGRWYLAALPAGAFIGLGLMLALRNVLLPPDKEARLQQEDEAGRSR